MVRDYVRLLKEIRKKFLSMALLIEEMRMVKWWEQEWDFGL